MFSNEAWGSHCGTWIRSLISLCTSLRSELASGVREAQPRILWGWHWSSFQDWAECNGYGSGWRRAGSMGREKTDICSRCKGRQGTNIRRDWGGAGPKGNEPGLTGCLDPASPLCWGSFSPPAQFPSSSSQAHCGSNIFHQVFTPLLFFPGPRVQSRCPECSSSPSALIFFELYERKADLVSRKLVWYPQLGHSCPVNITIPQNISVTQGHYTMMNQDENNSTLDTDKIWTSSKPKNNHRPPVSAYTSDCCFFTNYSCSVAFFRPPQRDFIRHQS